MKIIDFGKVRKKIEIKANNVNKKNIYFIQYKYFKLILLLFFIIIILFINYSSIYKIIFVQNKSYNKKLLLTHKVGIFKLNDIPPEKFECNILNEIKEKNNFKSLLSINELYFINGLIRKFKPKKIIEIGVCTGGTSATILNAIKDIEGAKLYSIDLEKKHYLKNSFDVGYIVRDYFPEFLNNWKLFTGNTTASFIELIGNDIDFAFIDTAHVMPGEVLNIIEILPFLKKNAIIAFDDIDHQARDVEIKSNNFHSCNNLLFSVLRGEKIIYNQNYNNTFNFRKLGAVILDDNQEDYYFEYFYLLTNNWSYMPQHFEIVAIREIIKKYYNPFFLSIFDKAVELNYKHLKMKGLLDKDYILYTFMNVKRKNPFS